MSLCSRFPSIPNASLSPGPYSFSTLPAEQFTSHLIENRGHLACIPTPPPTNICIYFTSLKFISMSTYYLFSWIFNFSPSLALFLSKDVNASFSCLNAMLLLSRFSRVRLCATPWTAAHQTSPSMGFSRQEYRSGVPLPSPNIYTLLYIKQISNKDLLYSPGNSTQSSVTA